MAIDFGMCTVPFDGEELSAGPKEGDTPPRQLFEWRHRPAHHRVGGTEAVSYRTIFGTPAEDFDVQSQLVNDLPQEVGAPQHGFD
jgi:hypothetical protein